MSRKADLRTENLVGSRLRNLVAALVIGAIGALAVTVATTTQTPSARARPVAPGFSAPSPSGSFSLASVRRHRAVLAFVQAGCGSCVDELRSLASLASGVPDARYVALNLPGGGSARDLQAFGESIGVRRGITYIADPNGTIARRYAIAVIDTVIVIDGSGRIRARFVRPDRGALARALAAIPA